MGTEIIRQITAEEWEYKRKKAELSNLEVKLAQYELDFATLRGELQNFQARYLAAVGFRYAELDYIEAEIAAAEARLKPSDHAAQQKAEQKRAQADETAKNTQPKNEAKKGTTRFKPTESLKKLYRQIAKQFHPDLATDEQERTLYQKLMAKANKAYQAGDEIGLQKIWRQWKKNSGIEKSDNLEIQEKIDRITRQINQIKERLINIEKEMAEIRKSALYQLKLKVEAAENDGSDLLKEMAVFLDQQIALAKTTLAKLNQITNTHLHTFAAKT